MQEDLRHNLLAIQDSLDRLPAESDDPVRLANELIWTFGEGLKATVNIYNFKVPTLVGTCRRRLETFTDILFYRLFPRFRPFPRGMGGRGTSFNEFPSTLPPAPVLSSNVAAVMIPNTVYLDQLTTRCDLCVLLRRE